MNGDIYSEAIKTLARGGAPEALDAPDGAASLSNLLCGDRVRVEIALCGGRVSRAAHAVRGCIPCRAAAVALGGALPGLDAAALEAARAALRAMLGGGAAAFGAPWEALAHFRPVAAHKSRHECVMLPFDAAAAAFADAARRAR